MAAIPKQRMYRAMYKAGLVNEKQIEQINKKLGNDRLAQRRFLKLWRQRSGHRFIGSLQAFAQWIVKHWDEIKFALGIVALFLDEEPEHKDAEGKRVRDEAEAREETKGEVTYVAPPKPQPQNPWTTYAESVNKVSDDDAELDRLIKEEQEGAE